MSDEVTAGDALAAIAEIEPDALKLVGDLMQYSAHSLQYTYEQLYLGERHAHEQTKERLIATLNHLDVIERRFAWLMGGPDWLLEENQA